MDDGGWNMDGGWTMEDEGSIMRGWIMEDAGWRRIPYRALAMVPMMAMTMMTR